MTFHLNLYISSQVVTPSAKVRRMTALSELRSGLKKVEKALKYHIGDKNDEQWMQTVCLGWATEWLV